MFQGFLHLYESTALALRFEHELVIEEKGLSEEEAGGTKTDGKTLGAVQNLQKSTFSAESLASEGGEEDGKIRLTNLKLADEAQFPETYKVHVQYRIKGGDYLLLRPFRSPVTKCFELTTNDPFITIDSLEENTEYEVRHSLEGKPWSEYVCYSTVSRIPGPVPVLKSVRCNRVLLEWPESQCDWGRIKGYLVQFVELFDPTKTDAASHAKAFSSNTVQERTIAVHDLDANLLEGLVAERAVHANTIYTDANAINEEQTYDNGATGATELPFFTGKLAIRCRTGSSLDGSTRPDSKESFISDEPSSKQGTTFQAGNLEVLPAGSPVALKAAEKLTSKRSSLRRKISSPAVIRYWLNGLNPKRHYLVRVSALDPVWIPQDEEEEALRGRESELPPESVSPVRGILARILPGGGGVISAEDDVKKQVSGLPATTPRGNALTTPRGDGSLITNQVAHRDRQQIISNMNFLTKLQLTDVMRAQMNFSQAPVTVQCSRVAPSISSSCIAQLTYGPSEALIAFSVDFSMHDEPIESFQVRVVTNKGRKPPADSKAEWTFAEPESRECGKFVSETLIKHMNDVDVFCGRCRASMSPDGAQNSNTSAANLGNTQLGRTESLGLDEGVSAQNSKTSQTAASISQSPAKASHRKRRDSNVGKAESTGKPEVLRLGSKDRQVSRNSSNSMSESGSPRQSPQTTSFNILSNQTYRPMDATNIVVRESNGGLITEVETPFPVQAAIDSDIDMKKRIADQIQYALRVPLTKHTQLVAKGTESLQIAISCCSKQGENEKEAVEFSLKTRSPPEVEKDRDIKYQTTHDTCFFDLWVREPTLQKLTLSRQDAKLHVTEVLVRREREGTGYFSKRNWGQPEQMKLDEAWLAIRDRRTRPNRRKNRASLEERVMPYRRSFPESASREGVNRDLPDGSSPLLHNEDDAIHYDSGRRVPPRSETQQLCRFEMPSAVSMLVTQYNEASMIDQNDDRGETPRVVDRGDPRPMNFDASSPDVLLQELCGIKWDSKYDTSNQNVSGELTLSDMMDSCIRMRRFLKIRGIIEGLQPETIYNFQVALKTKDDTIGSYRTVAVRTKKIAPTMEFSPLSVHERSRTMLIMKWPPPTFDAEDLQEATQGLNKLIGFQLRLRKKGESNWEPAREIALPEEAIAAETLVEQDISRVPSMRFSVGGKASSTSNLGRSNSIMRTSGSFVLGSKNRASTEPYTVAITKDNPVMISNLHLISNISHANSNASPINNNIPAAGKDAGANRKVGKEVGAEEAPDKPLPSQRISHLQTETSGTAKISFLVVEGGASIFQNASDMTAFHSLPVGRADTVESRATEQISAGTESGHAYSSGGHQLSPICHAGPMSSGENTIGMHAPNVPIPDPYYDYGVNTYRNPYGSVCSPTTGIETFYGLPTPYAELVPPPMPTTAVHTKAPLKVSTAGSPAGEEGVSPSAGAGGKDAGGAAGGDAGVARQTFQRNLTYSHDMLFRHLKTEEAMKPLIMCEADCLEPATKYEMQLAVRTPRGVGPFSPICTAETLARAPSMSVPQFSIVTPNSITLSSEIQLESDSVHLISDLSGLVVRYYEVGVGIVGFAGSWQEQLIDKIHIVQTTDVDASDDASLTSEGGGSVRTQSLLSPGAHDILGYNASHSKQLTPRNPKRSTSRNRDHSTTRNRNSTPRRRNSRSRSPRSPGGARGKNSKDETAIAHSIGVGGRSDGTYHKNSYPRPISKGKSRFTIIFNEKPRPGAEEEKADGKQVSSSEQENDKPRTVAQATVMQKSTALLKSTIKEEEIMIESHQAIRTEDRPEFEFWDQLLQLRENPGANLRVHFEVTGLQPEKKYVFQVACRTYCGRGVWSKDTEAISTCRLVPNIIVPRLLDTSVSGKGLFLTYHTGTVHELRKRMKACNETGSYDHMKEATRGRLSFGQEASNFLLPKSKSAQISSKNLMGRNGKQAASRSSQPANSSPYGGKDTGNADLGHVREDLPVGAELLLCEQDQYAIDIGTDLGLLDSLKECLPLHGPEDEHIEPSLMLTDDSSVFDRLHLCLKGFPVIAEWMRDVDWGSTVVIKNGGWQYCPAEIVSTKMNLACENATTAGNALLANAAPTNEVRRKSLTERKTDSKESTESGIGRKSDVGTAAVRAIATMNLTDENHKGGGTPSHGNTRNQNTLQPSSFTENRMSISSALPITTDTTIGICWSCPLGDAQSNAFIKAGRGQYLTNTLLAETIQNLRQQNKKNAAPLSEGFAAVIAQEYGIDTTDFLNVNPFHGKNTVITGVTTGSGGLTAVKQGDNFIGEKDAVQHPAVAKDLMYNLDNFPILYEVRYRVIEEETQKPLGWQSLHCTAYHIPGAAEDLLELTDGEIVAAVGGSLHILEGSDAAGNEKTARWLEYVNKQCIISPDAPDPESTRFQRTNDAEYDDGIMDPNDEPHFRTRRGQEFGTTKTSEQEMKFITKRGLCVDGSTRGEYVWTDSDVLALHCSYESVPVENLGGGGSPLPNFAYVYGNRWGAAPEPFKATSEVTNLTQSTPNPKDSFLEAPGEFLSKFNEMTSLIIPRLDPATTYVFQVRPITHWQLMQLYEKNRKVFDKLQERMAKRLRDMEEGDFFGEASTPATMTSLGGDKSGHLSTIPSPNIARSPMKLNKLVPPDKDSIKSLKLDGHKFLVLEKHYGSISPFIQTLSAAPSIQKIQVVDTTATTASFCWYSTCLQPILLPRLQLLGFDVRHYAKENGKQVTSTIEQTFVDKNMIVFQTRLFENNGNLALPDGNAGSYDGSGSNSVNIYYEPSTAASFDDPGSVIEPFRGRSSYDFTGGASSSSANWNAWNGDQNTSSSSANWNGNANASINPPFVCSIAYGKLKVLNLASATDYYMQIRSKTNAGCGKWSDEICCKTTLSLAAPDPPKLIYAQENMLVFTVELNGQQEKNLQRWECMIHNTTNRTSEERSVWPRRIRKNAGRVVVTLDYLEKGCKYQIQLRGVSSDGLSRSTYSARSADMETLVGGANVLEDKIGQAQKTRIQNRKAGVVDALQMDNFMMDHDMSLLAGETRKGLDGDSPGDGEDGSFLPVDAQTLQKALESTIDWTMARALKGASLASYELRPIDEEAKIQLQMHGGVEQAVAAIIAKADRQDSIDENPDDEENTSYYAHTDQLIDLALSCIPFVGIPGVFVKSMFYRLRNCGLIAELYGHEPLTDIDTQAMLLTCLIPGENVDSVNKNEEDGQEKDGDEEMVGEEVEVETAQDGEVAPGSAWDDQLGDLRAANKDPAPIKAVAVSKTVAAATKARKAAAATKAAAAKAAAASPKDDEPEAPIADLGNVFQMDDVSDITRAVARAVVKETVVLASGMARLGTLIDVADRLICFKPGTQEKSKSRAPEILAAEIFRPHPWDEQIPYLLACLVFWLLPVVISFVRFFSYRLVPIFSFELSFLSNSVGAFMFTFFVGAITVAGSMLRYGEAIKAWAQQTFTRLPAFLVFLIHAVLPGVGCFLAVRDISQPFFEQERGVLLTLLGTCSLLTHYYRWCDDVERANMLDDLPPPLLTKYRQNAMVWRRWLYVFLISVFVFEEILCRIFGIFSDHFYQMKVISAPGTSLLNFQTIYFFFGLIAATAQEQLLTKITSRNVLLRILGAKQTIFGGVLALCSGVFAMVNMSATVGFLQQISPQPGECGVILTLRKIGLFAGFAPLCWGVGKLIIGRGFPEVAMLSAFVFGIVIGVTCLNAYKREMEENKKVINSSYRILLLFPHTSAKAKNRAEQAMELAMRKTAVTSAKTAAGFVGRGAVHTVFRWLARAIPK